MTSQDAKNIGLKKKVPRKMAKSGQKGKKFYWAFGGIVPIQFIKNFSDLDNQQHHRFIVLERLKEDLFK